MNDIRRSRTLTPRGVAKVLALAARELFDTENAEKTLRHLTDWLQESEMPLGMNDKPNAYQWVEELAHELNHIISSDAEGESK